jgi:DNA polymerase-4
MENARPREIIHVDTDDFHATVARIKDPALRGRPVVVGYLSSRGVVVGTSREARETGVRSGMTSAQAKRLCPDAAFVQVDWNLLGKVSRAMFGVVRRYSPLVEPRGLDEGFIDYTGCSRLFGHARDAARRLQREVADALSLSVSLGVGSNKSVAVVASRAAKVAGIVDVPAGEERGFLGDFPLAWLPGIGERRARVLEAMGVRKIGTLAEIPAALIETVFGPGAGRLVERARGMDDRPVAGGDTQREGEYGAGETFPEDVIDAGYVDARLYALAVRVGEKLRRAGRGAKKIRLRLVYTDGYPVACEGRLPRITALDGEIHEAALVLLERAFRRRVKVRSLSLAAVSTVPFDEGADLFATERGRLDRLHRSCDLIRRKYGDGKILRTGRMLRADSTALKDFPGSLRHQFT